MTLEKKRKTEDVATKKSASNKYTNKQRVLIISSRGITARYRHLLEDFKQLIPHHKKDNKLDDKGDIQAVNEIAEMKSCNQVLYLETRKHTDLYMYISKSPQGPSAKFHVVNVHTMDELKLTGNCMLGSRPLLNFDSSFDTFPHLQLLKILLRDAFGTPLGHPKSKPFNDRIMSFFVLNNNIWVRNYQIIERDEVKGGEGGEKSGKVHLVEIGPRFVLVPIRIFSGSLGGATLYQNESFVSPNTERSLAKKQKGDKYTGRVQHNAQRKEDAQVNKLPIDELSNSQVFKE
jgi:ribosome biogenesis protein BRX1